MCFRNAGELKTVAVLPSVRRWFPMTHLFCHCLFLISLSFGALVKLGFVIVPFLGYLYLLSWMWLHGSVEAVKHLNGPRGYKAFFVLI